MKNTVLTVLAVLGFAGAGFFLIRSFRGMGSPVPEQYEAPGVCVACKQEVTVKHRYDVGEPFACPACSAKAVFKWRYCNDCNRRFVPKLQTNPDNGNAMVPLGYVCPACSCADVAYYVPDLPGQIPIGDAELPKFPPTKNNNNH